MSALVTARPVYRRSPPASHTPLHTGCGCSQLCHFRCLPFVILRSLRTHTHVPLCDARAVIANAAAWSTEGSWGCCCMARATEAATRRSSTDRTNGSASTQSSKGHIHTLVSIKSLRTIFPPPATGSTLDKQKDVAYRRPGDWQAFPPTHMWFAPNRGVEGMTPGR